MTSSWIFLNVLSSSQNRINIRISKIYTTSVINVIVTFIQSTLSKTLSAHTDVLLVHRSGKIQGHFGTDYRQDFCATCGSEKEDKIPNLHIQDDINNTDDNDSGTVQLTELSNLLKDL